MKRLCLLPVLLLLLFSSPAPGQDEGRLERRVRRFYTYYYLNHYDDMWGCFHASLRERLGYDRKTYIRTLRRSDLELFEAEVLDVRIDEDRGVVDVDLTFFYREVGNPIPRRHRMLWIWEDNRWWYAGSQLLEGEEALRGEVVGPEQGAPAPAAEEETPVATRKPVPAQARPEPVVRDAAPEAGEAPPVAAAETGEAPQPASARAGTPGPPSGEPQAAAAPPASDGPSGMPEELPGEAGLRTGGERHPGALASRLTSMRAWNRTNKLRELEPGLGPGDLEDLLEAARAAGKQVGRWSLGQAARLGVRYPDIREQTVEGLVEFMVMRGLRATAATGLGWLEAAEAREALEKLVIGAGSAVGQAAVRALQGIGDPRSADVLIPAWHRRIDPVMRNAIVGALGPCFTPEGGDLLRDVAADERIPMVERLAAARSLALLSPPEALETLQILDEELARQQPSRAWRLRLLTLAGRVRLEDPVAAEAITRLLDLETPGQPTVEGMELGRALGRAGDLETARLLVADSRASARYAGAIALREMAARGVDGAATAAREAAHKESDPLVAATLRGGRR